MRLFNTLSRKVEEFKPLSDRRVKLYTCGPTVYDHQTIGNLRTYVFYDTLKRSLKNAGYEVEHVMNITDVGHLTSDADEGEDKLEKGAKKSGQSVWQVADEFIAEFKQDLKQLNIPEPKLARATDFIEQQIEMVKILLDGGYAYITEQAIYFDVSKLPTYGELTGQKLSEKETASRSEVVADANKKHPQDFAVWFFKTGHFKKHAMRWPSPWGEGFPGWHLECSAIAHATLGDPLDIHSGAVDLIGTHHTNEIAQTEAAFGHKLAVYWVHGEHLLVDGQRMGKSLGNFYVLKDITERGYDPLALRLLYLQAHYRSQLNFTWESLRAAQATLTNLRNWASLRFQPKENSLKILDNFNNVTRLINDALGDDLNTPAALAATSGLIDLMSEGVGADQLGQFNSFLKHLDDVLGLELLSTKDIPDEQKKLLKEREAARKNKDFAKADSLRSRLVSQGVDINDSANGTIWLRK